jgi:soluble P-type ATPase
VTLSVSIPGLGDLRLEHLLLDVNGTLTNRGDLLDGVGARLGRLSDQLDVRLVSADTFGTLDTIAARMHVSAVRASTGDDKLRLLEELGRERCAVIGNGSNDALVLEAAAVGFAVIGPEGVSAAALRSADVVCASVTDALDLLLDPRALSATLRR